MATILSLYIRITLQPCQIRDWILNRVLIGMMDLKGEGGENG